MRSCLCYRECHWQTCMDVYSIINVLKNITPEIHVWVVKNLVTLLNQKLQLHHWESDYICRIDVEEKKHNVMRAANTQSAGWSRQHFGTYHNAYIQRSNLRIELCLWKNTTYPMLQCQSFSSSVSKSTWQLWENSGSNPGWISHSFFSTTQVVVQLAWYNLH